MHRSAPFVTPAGNVVASCYGKNYTAALMGDGGPVTTVIDSTSGLNTTIDSPSASDSLVASRGGLDAGGTVIFTTTGDGTFVTIADTSGPFAGFGGGVGVNASGQVAFFGTLDNGVNGIFTGPDPVRDKVMAVGDFYDGGTILSLIFDRGLNDAGQIVLRATFVGVRQEILVATPDPEPAACLRLLAACALAGSRTRRTGRAV